MTSTLAPPLADPAALPREGGAPRHRTRVFALPEARWAAAATVLFLVALPLQLTGAPAWAWGPLYALSYATGGWEPGWAGLRALKEKTLDVDLLMIVAALGAAAIGQVMDGALLIVIFATSGALEALATARTADSVRGLLDLAPATATRLGTDGGEAAVSVEELAVGDTILVRPGERIGADGRVLDGASDVDQATITGEPLPVAKEKDDEVFAGTLNGTGALRVRVERDASDSVIARIVRMVEEASETKAPTQLFIEKVEQRYSLGMVAAALAVFLVPIAFGANLTDALLRAMTFMIVASPCAVVLATMPPLLSAIANAGRHGVLVKSAVVMERLGQVDAVALDKTGTLTEGTPRVADVRSLAGSEADERRSWRSLRPPSTRASIRWRGPSWMRRVSAGLPCRWLRTSTPRPASGSPPPSTGVWSRSEPRPGCSTGRRTPIPPARRFSRESWRTAGGPRCWSPWTVRR